MKKIITIAALVMAFGMTGMAQFKFGAGAQLITNGGAFGVGGKGHYTITDEWAGQGSFHIMFDEAANWTLDLDAHYSGFDIGDVEGFSLAPFAGINIISFGGGNIAGVNLPSFTDTNINLGINGTLPISDGLSVYIEPKIILGSGSGFVIGAGVYF